MSPDKKSRNGEATTEATNCTDAAVVDVPDNANEGATTETTERTEAAIHMDVHEYAQLNLPANTAWYNPQDWPWTSYLESHAQTITDELRQLLSTRESSFSPWPDYLKTETDGQDSSGKLWKVLGYKFYCHFLPSFLEQMPRTAAILDRIPFVTSAGFSLLPGNTDILPHRGKTDSVLRYHLGLIVPPETGQMGMRCVYACIAGCMLCKCCVHLAAMSGMAEWETSLSIGKRASLCFSTTPSTMRPGTARQVPTRV